jgi:predicted RNA binding protein YcfA (HicA-like mRNA interferase family)
MVPRIPALSYREVDALLRRHGFAVLRQRGSHVHYAHPDGRRTTVPRHGRDVPSGLVAAIVKDAGIDPAEVRR